jgi:hypothetical protein
MTTVCSPSDETGARPSILDVGCALEAGGRGVGVIPPAKGARQRGSETPNQRARELADVEQIRRLEVSVTHAIRGLGRSLGTAGQRELVRSAADHVIHDDDRIFEFSIEQADHGWWENVGQPGTYQVRRRWTPASGLISLTTGRSGP